MRKIGLSLICVLLGLLLFMGTAAAEDALDKALKKGKLVVSTAVGTPPWAFKDPKTGAVDGFPVELARMFAKDLGVELEIKNYEWYNGPGKIDRLLPEDKAKEEEQQLKRDKEVERFLLN